ncbi:MAG: hypothetical protein JKY98_05225 [Gammaproteobacteria bacterium]|nr:hypothetical protein [Gammaproteobacteria bacterium]
MPRPAKGKHALQIPMSQMDMLLIDLLVQAHGAKNRKQLIDKLLRKEARRLCLPARKRKAA